MTIDIFAQHNRATLITTIVVLGVLALLIAPSTPAHAASGGPTPVLAEGAGMGARPSPQVRVLQRALHRRGYDLGAPGVDGRFGPLTAQAVRRMQADHGLAVDGIVGDQTRRALGLKRRALDAHRRSQREHGSKRVRERTPAAGRTIPTGTIAGVTTARDASVTLAYRSARWVDPFLAALVGGLIALLLALAVSAIRRREHRAASTTTVSPPDVPAETGARTDARPAQQAGASNGAAAAAPTPSSLPPGHQVIGYVTMSPDAAVSDDDGSADAIKAMCARHGWDLVEIVRDRAVGPTLERPGLGYALQRIADGHAAGLIVSDLQRLSRSIVDLGTLMAWFRSAHAALIALDLGIDTSTRKGEHVASALIMLSNHAHERIAHRSGNGLSELNGYRPGGRPAVSHDPELLERIASMRAAKMTLQAIADRLNAEGVPTLRGGKKWRPSSIQAALGYRRPRPSDHLPSLDRRAARS